MKNLQELIYQAMDCYWNKEDYTKAFPMLCDVHFVDETQCNWMLGICYELGHGVIRDMVLAKKYYRKGLDCNDDRSPLCGNHLLSLTGDGVRRLHSPQWKHWQEVSRLEEQAMNYLGDEYASDFDFDKGIELLERSAAIGSATACRHLCYAYHTMETLKPDYERAMFWAVLGVNGGDADCAYLLGNIYYHGFGQKGPDLDALYWYTKGALMGSKNAMSMLSAVYRDAPHIADNVEKYQFWHNLACGKKTPTEQLSETAKRLQRRVDQFARISQEEMKKALQADLSET